MKRDPADVHRCEAAGCHAWASFGFAFAKDRPLVWYCGQHRHLGVDRMAPAKTEPGPDPQQGRLL